MITRIWHGRTNPENGDAYLHFLLNDGTRDYLQTPGNLTVKVWREKSPDCHHFWTVSEWEDIEAVKGFAGEDIDKAVYYPFDEGTLLEFEKNVHHYNSYTVSNSRINEYLRQLKQLVDGGSWQGESFTHKLKDVDEIQAFTQPIPGLHSVAEILWHCIYWRTTLIRSIEGDQHYRDNTVEKMNFLPLEELRKKGWENLKSEWQESQDSLIKKLSEKTDDFLRDKYNEEKSFDHLIEGIVQHDIYHLGQIGLVKKMIDLKNDS